MTLEEINQKFKYKFDDANDKWTIMAGQELRGDCEDYSLTVLFHVVCNKSWIKFWQKLIFGNAKLCYVTTQTGGGHAVLKVGDQYIDNWTKRWVELIIMEDVGHKFHPKFFRWYHVAIKLLRN